MRRWPAWLVAAALTSAAASVSAAPAATREGPAPPPGPAPTREGPALPPGTPPKASTQLPGPKASPEPPGPKTSSEPPGPKASPTPEGPAQLPAPRGARATSARPWLAEPAPTGDPEGSRGSLALSRQRDGSMLYVDPGKRFTAAVNPDGSVRFGNRWGRDQHGERMRGSGAALRQIGPSGLGAVGVGITGPTEWLLFLSGQERDAAARTEFLNRTRDLRIQIAVAFTMRLLDTRLAELNQELLGLWSDASRSLPERRALLFARWDECDERLTRGLPAGGELPAEAVSQIDEARLSAADRARRTIEGFIRRQLPAGSPRAYTAQELAELNRRRVSAEPFAPYETRPLRAAPTPVTPPPVPPDMSSGAAQP